MLIRIRYRDSGYAARIATITVTMAHPPDRIRLFSSGMNEMSGVRTFWKLLRVNSVGILTDSVADESNEARSSHARGRRSRRRRSRARCWRPP
ncbi:hypothetical protein GCM10025867_14060 [Frondihabitans sucicola]|uniref:Uncharacterized protein n=1 Tax=Frondihabitans sucicola TaxID=1268041 RepID=A0ABM8GL77_9MICO|nr:hypothetical protein GCM10025867_14060 [Frondihabitans sucicola]